MGLSDDLLCLYTAEVSVQNNSHVVKIPEQEVEIGDITPGETYRVAMLAPVDDQDETTDSTEQGEQPAGDQPVSEGDIRDVVIEDIGDQGDGIGRIERGFVVIVPDADLGDEVTVEITHVADRYAVGEIIDQNREVGTG